MLLLLAGCATLGGGTASPGEELVGRTLRVETWRGERTALHFADEGRVRADFRGRSAEGRWQVSGRRLCFYWNGAPRECWPYRERFQRGRTRTVISDRGNVVRVTML